MRTQKSFLDVLATPPNRDGDATNKKMGPITNARHDVKSMPRRSPSDSQKRLGISGYGYSRYQPRLKLGSKAEANPRTIAAASQQSRSLTRTLSSLAPRADAEGGDLAAAAGDVGEAGGAEACEEAAEFALE